MEELRMHTRRKFLQQLSMAASAGILLSIPETLLAAYDVEKLTILHTNDVHSRIEPFTSGQYKGMGGVAQRAAIIKAVRDAEKNVLLLDAGDMFQGTPYFNLYHGEVELKAMSSLGYDVGTLGNHDFDLGLENLKTQLKHANFPLVNANYNFSDTVLHKTFKPYTIIKKGNFKIGIFGIGIELNGLVPAHLFEKTQYHEPIEIANNIAHKLKYDEVCDYIICLSHLGYKYENKKVSDIELAKHTKDIDLIIGGHTHTFLNKPTEVKNSAEKITLVNQVGFGGIQLGKIEVYFDKKRNKKDFYSSHVIISENTIAK